MPTEPQSNRTEYPTAQTQLAGKRMPEQTDSVLELACELIARPSVTPDDAGCQTIIGAALEKQGFRIDSLVFGDVTNLWAVLGDPTDSPLFVFAGHTDVVPTGPVAEWTSEPFVPTVRDGMLYGRGAADMKGSLAAMVIASDKFLEQNSQFNGALAYLITSDEEGAAVDGTRRVVEHLQTQGITPDYCIVGEPSSTRQVGDTVRIGRRGSLNGTLRIYGRQGHVAYPELADNPIHQLPPTLTALTSAVWDNGNSHFPPTSLQISNIHAGTGVSNVIPGAVELDFNLRFCTEQTSTGLKEQIRTIMEQLAVSFELDWSLSGEPFLTSGGALLDAVTASIAAASAIEVEASTGGGTSDGRFIAPMGCEVVELGPVNETIHRVDECVAISDLALLAQMYEDILQRLLGRTL